MLMGKLVWLNAAVMEAFALSVKVCGLVVPVMAPLKPVNE